MTSRKASDVTHSVEEIPQGMKLLKVEPLRQLQPTMASGCAITKCATHALNDHHACQLSKYFYITRCNLNCEAFFLWTHYSNLSQHQGKSNGAPPPAISISSKSGGAWQAITIKRRSCCILICWPPVGALQACLAAVTREQAAHVNTRLLVKALRSGIWQNDKADYTYWLSKPMQLDERHAVG